MNSKELVHVSIHTYTHLMYEMYANIYLIYMCVCVCVCSSASDSPLGLMQTLLACAAYVIIGPSLILLNKYILDQLNFPFPIFLSMLGVATSAGVARMLVSLGIVSIERQAAVEGALW